MDERIIGLIRRAGCLSMREISESLGYSGINRNVSDRIKSLIEDGRLEYLYPEKPRSPKQRICLPGEVTPRGP